ncbi:MAG: hypothetical protein PHF84_04355, partial [bacterium]|nr:hypothetical protein [bacterium]
PESDRAWTVPNSIYNARIVVDDYQNSVLSTNARTNYVTAAPSTARLGGRITITGGITNRVQVYLSGYNNSRYSSPVSGGQSYTVYGLQNNSYQAGNLFARNKVLPSVSGYNIYGTYTAPIDLSSGTNTVNITMTTNARTKMSGKVIDSMTRYPLPSLPIVFYPTGGLFQSNASQEETTSDLSGNYEDYYKGNGNYSYSVGDSSAQDSPYGVINIGSYYMNRNNSPVTQDYYIGPRSVLSVNIHQKGGIFPVTIRDAQYGNLITQILTGTNGMAVTTYPLSAGVYQVICGSYSNTNTRRLYTQASTNAYLLDGETLQVHLYPSPGARLYGIVTNSSLATGVGDCSLDVRYTNSQDKINSTYSSTGPVTGAFSFSTVLATNRRYTVTATPPVGYAHSLKQTNILIRSNTRIKLNVISSPGTITLVFTNWFQYTNNGTQVYGYGLNEGLDLDHSQQFATTITSKTSFLSVDSITKKYTVAVLIMPTGNPEIIQTRCSNSAGDTVIFSVPAVPRKISGRVVVTNTSTLVSPVEIQLYTMSRTQFQNTHNSSNGMFSFTNIARPGPYFIEVVPSGSSSYDDKVFRNLNANTTVTLALVPVDDTAPAIRYLSPAYNTKVKYNTIRFFLDDNGGAGVNTNSIKIQWLSGAGPGFGLQTLASNRVTQKNGWVILTNTGLTNYNKIRISAADLDKTRNSNFKTNAFIVDYRAPLVNLVTFTDRGGSHDNIFGTAENPYHLKLSFMTSETGNYSIWMDNNNNRIYDSGVDWYLTDSMGNKIKNQNYSNSIIYMENMVFQDDLNNYIQRWNIPQGNHVLFIELDDSRGSSVDDGNKVVTNISFRWDSQLPVITEAKTIDTNTIRVTFDTNSMIQSVLSLAMIDKHDLSPRYARSTNILNNVLTVKLQSLLSPDDEILFTAFSIRDKGWNNFNQTGWTTNKDGLKPSVKTAKSLNTNIIEFRFDERVIPDLIVISNHTVTGTNITGTNILFTVTPNLTVTESTNFFLIVHDLRNNSTNIRGKFQSGFTPQLRDVFTFNTNEIIFKFSKPVDTIKEIAIQDGKIIVATNFLSAKSNVTFTVTPDFGPDETNTCTIRVRDTASNELYYSGYYGEKLKPRFLSLDILRTNLARLTFNEPLSLSATNRMNYVMAWVSNSSGTPVTNFNILPSGIDSSLRNDKPSVVLLTYNPAVFKHATNALCLATNIQDKHNNLIDTNYRRRNDLSVQFDVTPPRLLSARSVSPGQIKFSFTEIIDRINSVSISNTTVIATNRSLTDVILTVSPAPAPDSTANFHITFQDMAFNQATTNGVYQDGIQPVLLEARTTSLSNILFRYSENITKTGSSLLLTGHTAKATNVNGTNIIYTVNPLFRNNERTNYVIIIQDLHTNWKTNSGLFRDGIIPGLVREPYTLDTTNLSFEFNEPVKAALSITVEPGKSTAGPAFFHQSSNLVFTVTPAFLPYESTNCLITVIDFSSNSYTYSGLYRETFNPGLLSCDVLSSNILQLKFSEPMAGSLTNRIYYNVAWVSNSGTALVTNRNNIPDSAGLPFFFGRTNIINLAFISPLFKHATNVLCTVTNVYDVHNNEISSNNDTAFDLSVVFDSTPPPPVTVILTEDVRNDIGCQIQLIWNKVFDASGVSYFIYTNSNPITMISPGLAAAAGIPWSVTNWTITGLTDNKNYYFAVTAVDGINQESVLAGSSVKGPVYPVRNLIQTSSDTIYSRLSLDDYIINTSPDNINSYCNFEPPDQNLVLQANSKLSPDTVDEEYISQTLDTVVRLTTSPAALSKSVTLSLPLSFTPENFVLTHLALYKFNPSDITWEYVSPGAYVNNRFEAEALPGPDTTFRVLVLKRPSFPDTSRVLAGPSLYKGDGDGIHFVNLTAKARIKVYTVTGKLVAELEEKDMDGRYVWDTKGKSGLIGSGVYIIRVENSANPKDFKILKIAVVR